MRSFFKGWPGPFWISAASYARLIGFLRHGFSGSCSSMRPGCLTLVTR